VHEGDAEAETAMAHIRKETLEESLEQNFTPSLARRLSRQFIEQTRQPIPRSPSVPRDNNKHYQSPMRETFSLIGSSEVAKRYPTSASSDQTEYRDRSLDRSIRRANSLLEPSKYDRSERHSPRRSISLFDDDDDDRLLPPLPRHIMTLGRKYKESARSNVGNARRENFHGYRTDKIQEEPGDVDMYPGDCKEDMDNNITETSSMSEGISISACNSNANLMDTTATTSSISARSCETSPTESSSNLGDYGKSVCKTDISKSFENRLLAAENLIKESKLKNLTPQRFNPNLSCNYKDTDKCDKEALITSDPSLANSVTSKRRSCIPSLRLRSGSLTREPSVSTDRRKSFAGSQDASAGGANQERSILSKFFRSGSSNKEIEPKDNNKSQKPKQHRISRFLRPDFFDTPREESQYVKEKEAQKAAENERRKSRFMRRKSESKERKEEKDEKICKEEKNEINALQKDKLDNTNVSPTELKNDEKEKAKIERQGSKSSFLHSLEKKLERLRSSDETTSTIAKPTMNGNVPGDRKERGVRECSAPPVECISPEPSLTEVKKTLSVEDLSLNKNRPNKNTSSTKGRVTSVLGLFKTNADTKQNTNSGNRSQNAIMSKLKRSPTKCAKSIEPSEEDATATSKIPTKFGRTDNKPVKKILESKKSPPKEKSKEREPIAKERKSVEQSREFKRVPEKLARSESSTSSLDKTKQEKTELLRKLSNDPESLQKVDNKQMESIANNEDKKLMKTKKNISSLDKNGSVTRTDKGADIDKKIKKPVISKEETDKDEINGAKKKKIVRVVKKVVKKSSDSSESKFDEKEKSRPLVKKKIMTTKKERSPDSPTDTVQNSIKGSNVDNQITARSSHLKQIQPNIQETSVKSNDVELSMQNTITLPKADASSSSDANVSAVDVLQTSSTLQNTSNSQNCSSSVTSNSKLLNSSGSTAQNASNFNTNQAKTLEQYRPSRASLKLDLSKIPQHTFRHATPKRDSPKFELPKTNSIVSIGSPKTDVPVIDNSSDKLMDCLSKMTHHANITGNKIIIDKPLRAKDVAELKREVTECAKIIENHIELQDDHSTSQNVDRIIDLNESVTDGRSKETAINLKEANEAKVAKEPLEDCTSEMFSPEEPESFDSWSICSADLNHNRGDLHSPQLHSPTSPSYSLFMHGDSSESVIDRIRRRSFYSRFNDRKRPSLTAPPPGISSATLPRRFSFNSSRERERNRLYNYGVPRTR